MGKIKISLVAITLLVLAVVSFAESNAADPACDNTVNGLHGAFALRTASARASASAVGDMGMINAAATLYDRLVCG